MTDFALHENDLNALEIECGQFFVQIASVYAGLAWMQIRSARFRVGKLKGKLLSVFWPKADTVLTQADGIEDGETENPHEWRGSCGLRSWCETDKLSAVLCYSMGLLILRFRALQTPPHTEREFCNAVGAGKTVTGSAGCSGVFLIPNRKSFVPRALQVINRPVSSPI
jgi:hypothetical protein